MNIEYTDTQSSFLIHDAALPELRKKLEHLSRQAQKLGLDAYEMTIGEPQYKKNQSNYADEQVEELVRFYPVTVKGQQPVLNGWTFIAHLSHTPNGNLISKPQYARDKELSSDYRDCPPNCNHCNTNRNRNTTYLFANETNNEIKQIGSTCIQDYFGHPHPTALLALWDNVLKIEQWAQDHYDEEEEMGARGGQALYDFDQIVELSCAVIRENGRYHSATNPDSMGFTTKEHVLELLRRPQTSEKNKKMPHDIIKQEDIDQAKQISQWLESLDKSSSEFEHNLRVHKKNAVITQKHIGLVCAAPVAYDRAHNAQQKQQTLLKNSQHIGQPKEKLKNRQVIFDGSPSYSTQWGETYIVKMTDVDTGAQFTWRTASPIKFKRGQQYTINATIKAHSEYKDIKQTELTRVNCPDLKLAAFFRENHRGCSPDDPETLKHIKKQLLKSSDINAINSKNQTLLEQTISHIGANAPGGLVSENAITLVKTLLDHGADPLRATPTPDGINHALDLALYKFDPPYQIPVLILDHLQQKGVDLSSVETMFSQNTQGYYGPGQDLYDDAKPLLELIAKYDMPMPEGHNQSVQHGIKYNTALAQQPSPAPKPSPAAPAPDDDLGQNMPQATTTHQPEPEPEPSSPQKPVKDSQIRDIFSLGF